MPSSPGYLRFPSLRGEAVSFVAEDDVWLGDVGGGRAYRLTAERMPVAHTRLSPDGTQVAYTSRRDGAPEVHLVDIDGGAARRLTYWGSDFTRVVGWSEDGDVLATSAAGHAFRSRTWAYAVPTDGSPPRRLPYGPVNSVAVGGPGTVVGTGGNRRGAAAWKRYRGGTAGRFWFAADGATFEEFLTGLDSQLEDPGWLGERLAFLSDHEGYGNVYSVQADGTDLRRHSDHGDFYARAAHTDGARLVYQCAGRLWLVPDLAADSAPQRLDLRLGGPRTALSPHLVSAGDHLGDVVPDQTGRASALEVRGTVQWVTHRDGPAIELGGGSGVRLRLPRLLGVPEGEQAQRLVWVSDAEGPDVLQVGSVGGPARTLTGAGVLGRVLDLAVSPDGARIAAASHDGRVLLIDAADGSVRELDRSDDGDASGLVFSPDSAWLAWSHAGPEPLRQIKLAAPADGRVIEATALRFTDSEPVFTLDGAHLAFLSVRTLDPVYDALVFDLSFVAGTRPYLLPLGARTPSPFEPSARGRALATEPDPADKTSPPAGTEVPVVPEVPPVTVDEEGLTQRLVAVPVPAGNYSGLQAVHGGLVWLLDPQVGVLGDGLPRAGTPPRSVLQRYDLSGLRLSTLDDKVDDVAVSGDGRWLVVTDGGGLRVVPADHKAAEGGEDGPSERVDVDLARVRVLIDPAAEWRQMYDENAQLMRDHFWIADMGGVDYDAAVARYRPLLDELGSRDDLSELLWEIQGELGSSHAYETPPTIAVAAERRLGLLGADIAPDEDGIWRIERVVPGESSAPLARSPLHAPGVGVVAGTAILAVGGRPVDPVTGPGPLLVGTADQPVALTVAAPGGDPRTVVVVPLGTELPLRYQDWVADRRRAVHEASAGRAGYLHIPDMVGNGWAQFHRDIRIELLRESLVVDVRDNNGGHVSALVLEKLARNVQGWATIRHQNPGVYPEGALRGPLVAVTNEHAGSDGDIVTAMIRQLGLGPVVGRRTWGGVIGIDGRYELVDGTDVTQPRYSFWFADNGWGVENYGVDPDVEVAFPPQAWAAGQDPQLLAAVELVLQRLTETPAAQPPSTHDRPDRAAPVLPPRP